MFQELTPLSQKGPTIDSPTSKTLRFAEDEPELLEIYTHWFQRLGYNVLQASNGSEASQFAGRTRLI